MHEGGVSRTHTHTSTQSDTDSHGTAPTPVLSFSPALLGHTVRFPQDRDVCACVCVCLEVGPRGSAQQTKFRTLNSQTLHKSQCAHSPAPGHDLTTMLPYMEGGKKREGERERIRHTERKKDIPLERNINFPNDVHIRQSMISCISMDPIETPLRCKVGMPRDGHALW